MVIQSSDAPESEGVRPKRTRMVRSYPVHTLKEALSVGRAIQESNSGLPFDRVLLAKAMGTTPASSGFTMRLNSSTRYGLTQGGYSDASIELTPRGEAIVAPRDDQEMRQALTDAALQPELFRRFYQTLNGKRIPQDAYAQNTLQRELGIHPNLTGECLGIIKANGLHVGIVTEVGGALYVSLTGSLAQGSAPQVPLVAEQPAAETGVTAAPAPRVRPVPGRIFIGHTGDIEVVEFLAKAFEAFEVPCTVLAGELEESSPIPADISRDMRSCTAEILALSRGSGPFDETEARPPVDRSAPYLLGAMSVLYGDRVLLFAEAGLDLWKRSDKLRQARLRTRAAE